MGDSNQNIEDHASLTSESDQKKASEELERRVAERTSELTALNEQLGLEMIERERAELELRQSEERFRTMVEGVKDYAILMLDPEGRIVTWNEGAERITQYRLDEVIGQHFSIFYTEDAIERHTFEDHLEAAAREGRLNDEGWRVRKDGSRFWASVVITAIRNASGALVGFSNVTRDLTERKRAEAQLAYQANLLANVHDAIFATDEHLNLTSWNRAAEELYGWRADEVLGLKVQDVIRSETSADQRSDASKLLAEIGHYHAEVLQYRRDDWPLWIQGDTMALRDEAGQITGYVCAFRDVSKRKTAEAEALALKDELAAELTAMTRLHELSTRLLASTELQPLLEEVLDATIDLLQADFGNIQLYDPKTRALEIVAHRGFQQDFLDYFSSVEEDGAACGRALKLRGRVVIEDVETDPGFARHRQIASSAGFRAVQSTPLFSRRGDPLGMISTHFRQPHRPSEHELRLTDLYARQAAELIERKRAEEALRASEERFRSYFELGLIGMAITSPDKGIIEVNDELCRILGYERSEMLQKTWADMTYPDDLAPDLVNFERAMAGEIDGYTMDKRWIRKDGRIIDSIVCAKCLRRADGSVDYFVGLVQDITDRKKAEASVRKAHERVDMIVNSISDQFFGLSKDWRFNYLNKHAADQVKALGKDPADLIGKVVWDEFEYVPNEEAMRRVMSERVLVSDELYYEPLGEWVENHMYPSPDGGLVTFQRYITKRKRAEEELRRSEAYLAEAQRLSHTASWAWNVFTGDVFWSQELFRIYGVDPEQVKPGYPSVMQYIHPEDRARAQTTFENAVREEKDYELPYRIVWPDGTIRHVNNLAHPVFDESGKLIEYVGTTIDTTDRTRAEARLREYEKCVEGLEEMIVVVDRDYRYLLANRAFLNYRGLTREQLVGHLAADLLNPGIFERVAKAKLDEALRGKVVKYELRYNYPKLGERDLFISYFPIEGPTGVDRVACVLRDITKRKQIEATLSEVRAALAHATRVTTLGELTASIAHEVNQPLAAIVTNGQASLRLLSREEPDLDGTREAIEAMILDGMRASEVIKRIRALMKKSGAGRSTLNINETIQQVIALIASQLSNNRVSLRTSLGVVPLVVGDRIQLQQVLLNLILNGNEAMIGKGWQPREMLISSNKVEPNQVRVAVSDTGIGLDPGNSGHIFDAFFTTKADHGGLGLGLSVSRTIVEAHGGKLWATPNEGKGATFQFTLPTSAEASGEGGQ